MKCIEVCAGAGGLALGQELAGFEHVLLLEKDKTCCETLRANRPDWNVVCGDMNNFNVLEFMDEYNLQPLDIDILSGGIPCQPFSYAGKKQGMEDVRANVFAKFIEMVKRIQPKVVLIENVKGLLSMQNSETLKNIIMKSLEDNNYHVTYKVLNANDYCVPQKRERLIIVGTHTSQHGKFTFPEPQLTKPTIHQAFENINSQDAYQKECYAYNDKMKSYLEKIPPGGCWTSLPEAEQKELLGKSFFSGDGKRGIARRLAWDEPSLTLTTSPIQIQTCRCHPSQTRPLTVREYARIQTFPDNWIFAGGKNKKYHQIGNAVPVNLAEAISKSIREFLEKNEVCSNPTS